MHRKSHSAFAWVLSLGCHRRNEDHVSISMFRGRVGQRSALGRQRWGLVAGAGAGLGLSAVEGTAVGGEGRRALGVRARRPSQGDLRSAIDPDIEGGAGVVQQWVEQAAAGHNPWLRVGLLAAGGRPGLADRWGGCGGCWPEWLVADLRGGSAWGRSVSQGSRDGVVIRTPDRRLRVFVSSTLGELAEERRAVSRAISALRLTPVMFEAGARPYSPVEVYRGVPGAKRCVHRVVLAAVRAAAPGGAGFGPGGGV